MRKILVSLILALSCTLARAQPLDVPYQVFVQTTSVNSITLSSVTIPASAALINANKNGYAWCIDHAVVSAASASTVTFLWGNGTGSGATTTDFAVVSAANVPWDSTFPYRTPYCAPVGQSILKVNSSVAGSTVTLTGYLFKGWNP
jgi:hypothetical protein